MGFFMNLLMHSFIDVFVRLFVRSFVRSCNSHFRGQLINLRRQYRLETATHVCSLKSETSNLAASKAAAGRKTLVLLTR